jgi:ATP-dependent RNA helicase DeaD
MHTYRIEVGKANDITPGNIVGAIANEAGLEAKYIGRIELFDNYANVDLPEGMPDDVLSHLKDVAIGGKTLDISFVGASSAGENRPKKPMELKERQSGGDRRVMEKASGKAPRRK